MTRLTVGVETTARIPKRCNPLARGEPPGIAPLTNPRDRRPLSAHPTPPKSLPLFRLPALSRPPYSSHMRLPISILYTFLALLPARLLAVWTPTTSIEIHIDKPHYATRSALSYIKAQQNPTFALQSPSPCPPHKTSRDHTSLPSPQPINYTYTSQIPTTTTPFHNQPQPHIPTLTTPTPPIPTQQPHTNQPTLPQGLALLLAIAPLLPRPRDPRLRRPPTTHSPQAQTYTYNGPLPPTRRTRYSRSRTPNPTQRHLTYYGFRYYDPETGRWPNRDPIEGRVVVPTSMVSWGMMG